MSGWLLIPGAGAAALATIYFGFLGMARLIEHRWYWHWPLDLLRDLIKGPPHA